MASQADTLNLAASVVDQFSKPLADLTRQLKTFSSVQDTTNARGKRSTEDHYKAYRSLSEQTKITSENVKKLLTPAIEGLGLSTIVATRSIGSFTAGLRDLGGHAQTLENVADKTGLATQKIREYEEAGKRFGISVEQTDAALEGLADRLNQQKKGKGDFMTAFIGQPADLQAYVRSLAGMTVEEATDSIRRRIASTKGEERNLLASLFKLPPNIGEETDEVFARVQANMASLSAQSLEDLKQMNQSWFDLKEAIEGASNSIEARFATALTVAYKGLAEFAKQHPYIALIAGSFASMSGSIVQMFAGLVVLKSILGGARAATPTAAAAGGGLGITGLLGSGLAVGAGALAGYEALKYSNPNPIKRPEDIYKPGEGKPTRHQSGTDLLKGWTWGDVFGVEAQAGTDPRSGPGAGHRALMARGAAGGAESNFGSEVRDQVTISKGVSTGAKEGVLAALYQWFSDPSHTGGGLGAGGGGAGLGTPGTPGGSPETPGGGPGVATPGTSSRATGRGAGGTTGRASGGRTPAPEGVMGVAYKAGELEGVLGTDQAHYDAFRNTVAGIESGKRGYDLLGGSGGHFAGRYQMGALGSHTELQDTARSLGEATPSVQEFLKDPKMQERFFERYTLNHHKYLMAHSSEYAALSQNEKLAMLGYAHNQGAGGAAQYLRTHQVGHDAFGTGGDTYVRAIRKAEEKLGSAGHPADENKSESPESDADRMKRESSERMREDFRRRGWKWPEPEKHSGLDSKIRQQMASVVKHEGHAKVSIDLKGFPQGTRTASSATGVFKEVRLNRGRAMSAEA
jgi:hypothetical protein